MSAVIRVKRRCNEEPLDALILNCKRRKTEEETAESSTVLQFAGTLQTQEEDIFKHINKPTKSEIEANYKKHFTDIKDKIREQIHSASKDNRYKVVNLYRSNTSTDSNEAKEEAVTIVDIESSSENKENEFIPSQYVYDLYYTNSYENLGELYEKDVVGIYPLNNELVYGSNRDNGLFESDTETDDSNDENNWRNEYPEEEGADADSINEDDMIDAMNRVALDGENELSSDDGQEGFIYSIDSEAAGFEEDIDDSDVNRYGEQYARFRARNKDNEIENPYYDYDDAEEDDGFAYN